MNNPKVDQQIINPAEQNSNNKNTIEDFEKFVSSLKIEGYSEEEISFQKPGKERIPLHAIKLGFKNPGGKTWRDLLSILNDESLEINIRGVDADDTNANRKRLYAINKKLLNAISKEFEVDPPKRFNLYEKDKTKGVGVYRFKFQSKKNDLSTKDYCRKKFSALAKIYQSKPTTDLLEILEIRGKEYSTKGYISEHEKIKAITLK